MPSGLLSHVPRVSQEFGRAALHYGAIWGHLAIVKRLLLKGADPSLRTNVGQTALDLAQEWGHNEIVALLSEPRCARPPPKKSERPTASREGSHAPSWAHASTRRREQMRSCDRLPMANEWRRVAMGCDRQLATDQLCAE